MKSTLLVVSLISTVSLARKQLIDKKGKKLEQTVEDCLTQCVF